MYERMGNLEEEHPRIDGRFAVKYKGEWMLPEERWALVTPKERASFAAFIVGMGIFMVIMALPW